MTDDYLAGFFDGEGCIDVQVMYPKPPYDKKFYCRPRIRLAQAQTGMSVLEALKESYGGILSHRAPQNDNQQPSVSWEILNKDGIVRMLKLLEPKLLIKKHQARLCLWWFENCAGRTIPEAARRAFAEELKLMKRDPQRLSEEAVAHIESLMR